MWYFVCCVFLVPPVYSAIGFNGGGVTISSDNNWANITLEWEIDQGNAGT